MKNYYDIATDGGSDVIGQVTDQMARLAARLDQIRHVVAVMSGKGGVGKSTLTTVLAEALHLMDYRIGIVDADISGPSIAYMTGVRDQTLALGPDGMQPAVSAQGIKVVSMDLFLPQDTTTAVLWEAPTQEHSYTWRPMVEMGALRELIADTAWGVLDVLLVDLPPGSDRLPNLADLIAKQLSGTIVVTGPTAVSQMVVSRSIMAASRSNLPIIGLVENMSADFGGVGEQSKNREGSSEMVALAHGVPFLGNIPFDPRLALATDRGEAFLTAHGDTPAGRAMMAVARQLQQFLSS